MPPTRAAKILALATTIALVWANSPFADGYLTLWQGQLPETLTLGGRLPDLRHWVNDGLMTLFFLVVALEIKRELTVGALSRRRAASLPAFAALGGMVVPALIFAAFNAGTEAAQGWAIPMATDIAFAMGAIALLGDRIPRGLKVFLLSLAIADDVGAIAVIAVFYAEAIDLTWLAIAAGLTALLFILPLLRIRGPGSYLGVGAMLWVAILLSGVHPTIAGVLLAFSIPTRAHVEPDRSERLELALQPVSAFLVVPLFALANAGVILDVQAIATTLTSGVGAGITLGLLVGKPFGIVTFSWLAVRSRLGELPAGMGWRSLIGAGALAGIGFTVSLFVADLSFGGSSLGGDANRAVILGSVGSALVGTFLLWGPRSRDLP